MFKLLLPAVLLLGATFVAVTVPLSSASSETLVLFAFALLAHIPAFVPVALYGQLHFIRVPLVKRYPEILAAILLALSWGICGALANVTASAWTIGAVSAVAISLGFVGVRLVRLHAEHKRDQFCSSATLPLPSASNLFATHIYLLRTVCALVSCATLIWAIWGGTPPVFLAMPAILTGGATVLLALTSRGLDIQSSDMASGHVAPLLARQLQAKPASIAVYHAGTSDTAIAATVSLCETLNQENLPFVVITRERKSLLNLAETSPTHLWIAPTLASLSGCVQNGLESILYAQDTPKNSHFTRFSQYRHVLFTAFSELDRVSQLPKTLALYTDIVPGSETQATRWRVNAFGDLAQRVSTTSVSPQVIETPASASQFTPEAAQTPLTDLLIGRGDDAYQQEAA